MKWAGMLNKPESLLQPANPAARIFLGWLCAFISFGFVALILWVSFLVWRNSGELGGGAPKVRETIGLFAVLIVAASLFLGMAFRLIARTALSSFFLRFWGTFFCVTTTFILAHAVVQKDWDQLIRVLPIAAGTAMMGIAAFKLARRRGSGSGNSG